MPKLQFLKGSFFAEFYKSYKIEKILAFFSYLKFFSASIIKKMAFIVGVNSN